MNDHQMVDVDFTSVLPGLLGGTQPTGRDYRGLKKEVSGIASTPCERSLEHLSSIIVEQEGVRSMRKGDWGGS